MHPKIIISQNPMTLDNNINQSEQNKHSLLPNVTNNINALNTPVFEPPLVGVFPVADEFLRNERFELSEFHTFEIIEEELLEKKRSCFDIYKKSLCNLGRKYNRISNETELDVPSAQQIDKFDISCVQYNIYMNCFTSILMFCFALQLFMLAFLLVIFTILMIILRLIFVKWIPKRMNSFIYSVSALFFIYITVIFLVYKEHFVIGSIVHFGWLTVMICAGLLLMLIYKIVVLYFQCTDYISLKYMTENENTILACMTTYIPISFILLVFDIQDNMIILCLHYSTLILIYMFNSSFMLYKLKNNAKCSKAFIVATVVAGISIIITILTSIYGFNHMIGFLRQMKYYQNHDVILSN